MADTNKMNRTWLCSVVFIDIVNYSSQSVDLQMKWKDRFNGYLGSAIKDVPEDERVILDTGDGAAVCFLGAPEAAMFAALELWHSLLLDEREQEPPLRARIGINLGPIKLVRDINGAPNAIGDGMNAGQRVMSFAGENQILVSQSFFEVVSRLSDDYKTLFRLKGVEKDKHVREHTVYDLSPPGVEHARVPAAAVPQPSAPPDRVAETLHEKHPGNKSGAGNRPILLLLGGVTVALIAVAGAWYFLGSASRAKPTAVQASPPSAAKEVAAPAPTATPAALPAAAPPDRSPATPVASSAQAAYDDGMRLIDKHDAAGAVRRFDDAINAQADYIDAYVGRAEARRGLLQYDLSMQDCNKIIQLDANEPRGYNCRGLGRQLLQQYDGSLSDLNEAIRRKPTFAHAYGNRGTTYSLLQQNDRALHDFDEAIRLMPRNPVFRVKRGNLYSSLKQYDKAIRDFTEAIRLEPNTINAYRYRALAEQASGDRAGAAADRAHIREQKRRE
jgi:tetratricopeptide (TPR) repeat protein/class 3 adenylate cyclase